MSFDQSDAECFSSKTEPVKLKTSLIERLVLETIDDFSKISDPNHSNVYHCYSKEEVRTRLNLGYYLPPNHLDNPFPNAHFIGYVDSYPYRETYLIEAAQEVFSAAWPDHLELRLKFKKRLQEAAQRQTKLSSWNTNFIQTIIKEEEIHRGQNISLGTSFDLVEADSAITHLFGMGNKTSGEQLNCASSRVHVMGEVHARMGSLLLTETEDIDFIFDYLSLELNRLQDLTKAHSQSYSSYTRLAVIEAYMREGMILPEDEVLVANMIIATRNPNLIRQVMLDQVDQDQAEIGVQDQVKEDLVQGVNTFLTDPEEFFKSWVNNGIYVSAYEELKSSHEEVCALLKDWKDYKNESLA